MPIDYELGKLQKVRFGGDAIWEELTEPGPTGVIQFSRESRTVTRIFRVPLENISAFFTDCYQDGVTPSRHPSSFFSFLYVDTVTLEPFDAANMLETDVGMLEPDFYKATVTYSPFDRDSGGGSSPEEVLTGSVNFTLESMTLPGYALSFVDTPTVPISDELNFSLQIPITDRSILVTRQSSVNFSTIRSNIGCVNSADFDGAAAETLLYTGASVRWKFDSTGKRSFDTEHHFKEKRIQWGASVYGWNHHFDKKTGNWKKVVYYQPGGGSAVYPYKPVSTFGSLIAI